jgi:ribosome-associated heat shock protein Hsp15
LNLGEGTQQELTFTQNSEYIEGNVRQIFKAEQMKLRVDIWLHRARLYKSRTQATAACREGKIMVGEKFAQPHTEVQEGDRIKLRSKGLYRTYVIREAADINLSKKDAPRMYEEQTDAATAEKFRQVAEADKLWRTSNKEGGGRRPSKKERRDIDKLKGR